MASMTEVKRRRQVAAADGSISVRARLMADGRGHWARVTEECSSALQWMGGPEMLGVTSSARGEGRSTIAVGMAFAQTYRAKTTILLEADLEKPSLARLLDLDEGPGVAELLRNEAELEECIQVADEALAVVTAGAVRGRAADLLPELARCDLVARMSKMYDALVVDLPPFVDFGVGLARSCPAIVAVVRAGSTPLEAVQRLGSELNHPPVMLNRADENLPCWLRTMLRTRP